MSFLNSRAFLSKNRDGRFVFELLRAVFYSDKISEVYNYSGKVKRWIVSSRHFWDFVSDVLHLIFVCLTLEEEKTMPTVTLILYCLLLIFDTVLSYNVTNTFVDLFKSKIGVISANIILKFIFGPLKSYLEFQYFGRTIEGIANKKSVILGICIAIFDLVREVVDVKINFRLIRESAEDSEICEPITLPSAEDSTCCFKNISSIRELSEDFELCEPTIAPSAEDSRWSFKHISSEKLREVITIKIAIFVYLRNI